jgi:15-cis-phytoene synthase
LTNPIAKIVRRARSNFFWSFVFLDSARREAIFAAYAFARHTDDIVDDAPSVEDARIRLRAWRDDLDDCYAGAPRSDITKALQPIVEAYAIPKDYFVELVNGVEMDLTTTRYDTFDDLRTYCYRVASVVGLICIEIFGYTDPKTKTYAINLGLALQLTNILRDIGEDAGRDRIYLPQEDLERFGLTEERILNRESDEAFKAMMAFQCDRARAYYKEAADHLSGADRKGMFPAETMGRIYYAILEKIEKRDYDVYAERITVSPLWKVGIAAKNWMIR